MQQCYCEECDDFVEFTISDEVVKEKFKDKLIEYRFKVGRCKQCNSEVVTDQEYIYRKSEAKNEAYKKTIGLITLDEITELMNKYDLGKESLADISGFGKVTIKRYYEGFYPSKDYSDILFRILNEESFFKKKVEENKGKLKNVALRKIIERSQTLDEINDSKIYQIANYIITHLGEVTPLALEKLLFFSNGVNYALNGTRLINEDCRAWVHGPVYPVMYNKYKKYGYKPIDDGIYSNHGCLVSKLTDKEIKAIDLVINTFGLFSPRMLEKISHSQKPWLEKRVGIKDEESGNELIDEKSVSSFYKENKLDNEETIMSYIIGCIREC